MSFRTWIIAIAFGLIASLGQAQEQTQSPGGQAESEQTPTEALPLPFPVEIVEDQSATDARESREEEARQREIEDLVAQQGMNAATQAMNDATQRMAEYAFWSTVMVGIGTALLFVTLGLTWQANRAAVKAVEITEQIGLDQLRPWMLGRGVTFFPNTDLTVGGKMFPEAMTFRANWHNTGQAPAIKTRVDIDFVIVPSGADIPPFNFKARSGTSVVGRDSQIHSDEKYIVGDDFDRFKAFQTEIIVFTRCDYSESFRPDIGRSTETTYRCKYSGQTIDANGVKWPRVMVYTEGPQNNAT